jgi:hypothetical protein
VYVVRANDGKNRASAVLFVAPSLKEKTIQITAVTGIVKSPDIPEALIAKLLKGMTGERIQTAAKIAIAEWLKNNAASLGATTTLCIVCFAPGGQFACGACASSGVANTIDLGIEVMKKLIDQLEKDKVLTKDESKTLRTFMIIGEGLLALHNIKDAPTKLEKALEIIRFSSDQAFTEGAFRVLFGYGVDETKKGAILIRLVRMKP